MRTLTRYALILSLLGLLACSSGGDGGTNLSSDTVGSHLIDVGGADFEDATGPGADTVDDEVSPPLTDSVTPDGEDPDVGDPDTGDPDAAVPDGQDPETDTMEPVEALSEAYLQAQCQTYCGKIGECHDAPPPVDCVEDCLAELEADPDRVKNLLCWMMGDDCAMEEACMAASIPDAESCEGLCDQAEGCGLLPHMMLGSDHAECGVQCSAFSFLAQSAGMEAMLDCVHEQAEACDGVGMLNCIDESSFCDEICDKVALCGNIPGLFADTEACMADCDQYEGDRRLALLGCVSIGADDPALDCPPQDGCFPPPQEMAAGADDFCAALLTLCYGTPDFDLPNDPEVCGWLMTGFTVYAPEVDFTGASECLAGYEDCESAGGMMGACLTPPYAPCVGMCEQVQACFDQAPEPPSPDEWGGVDQCVSFCSSLHIQDAAATDELIDCIEDGDCAGIGLCFQAAFPEE
jgi:hypothetical protein